MPFNLLFAFLIFILSISASNGGESRDVGTPESLPAGWCNKKFGSPTRTTGECICHKECTGPRCRREMGLSFYSYKECPTCQCISASGSSAASTSSQREETIPLASNNKVDNPPEVTKPVIKNIK